MNYQHYRREDFVADSYFRRWVKQPDEASIQYWKTFLAEHPEQRNTIEQAAELVRQMSTATTSLAAPADRTEEDSIWQAVRAQIESNPHKTSGGNLERPLWRGWSWLVAAASIVAVVVAGWWWRADSSTRASRQPVATATGVILVEKVNTSTRPQLVTLPDGSSVILQEGSQIKYLQPFDSTRRVVHLIGEAYFEVTKNASRPFLVYANELVTKVLGTSFYVRAYADDKDVVVTVRSGRVSVFTKAEENQQQKINSPALEGVVLTRNQQIVFARQEVRLARPKEVDPAIVPKTFAFNTERFVFEATPVSVVFDRLEKAYGVDIIYDKETMAGCRLTTDLTDEPLSEKMTIICKSIEASYTMTDSQIVVTGQGCQP